MNIFRAREIFKICIIAILVFLLLLIPSFGDVQNVTVSVIPDPKIDVVLSQSTTAADMTNMEKDLKAKLESDGFKTNNMKFQTIERNIVQTDSTDVDFSTAVNNWKAIGEKVWHADNNGNVYIDLTAGSMSYSPSWTPEINYNSCKPGWYGEALINDNKNNLKDIEAKFTLVQGGTLLGGFCFNTRIEKDGSLSGYFFNISAHSGNNRLYKMDHYAIDDYFSHGANSIVWCANNGPTSGTWIGDTKTNGVANSPGNICIAYNAGINKNIVSTIYPLVDWNRTSYQTNAEYHVITNSETGHIQIFVNNNKVVDLYDKTYTSGTYGFWGNNCEQKKSMYIKSLNITATEEKIKTFQDVLHEPTWRDNAYHILMNVNDEVDETMTGADVAGENSMRLLNDKIHLLQWGRNANKDSTINFIKQMNDGNGMYTDNSNYQQAVTDTANYIENLVKQGTSSQYVIVRRRY